MIENEDNVNDDDVDAVARQRKTILSALIFFFFQRSYFSQSRGCSLFSTSHSEHSVLRLAIVLGRRILIYRWSVIIDQSSHSNVTTAYYGCDHRYDHHILKEKCS